MEIQFINAFHEVNLKRFPYNKKLNLQAWDAADELLLNHLSSIKSDLTECKLLIFNDAFGALTTAMYEYHPDTITDSFISQLAIKQNFQLNKFEPANIEIFNSLSNLDKCYDYILIKAPKTLEFFRYFLSSITNNIHKDTQLIVAGMVKSMPKSIWSILEETIGTTTTSLTKKKAKLIFAKPERKTPKPLQLTTFIQEQTGFKIFNHANVFSKQSLDIGTRFLLQNLPKVDNINSIIDLGCGNGIVGLNLAALQPKAQITLIDESYMAIESAKLTCEYNLLSINKIEFVVNNCLDGFKVNSVDLIVCNPPFHQSHSIGTHIAIQMFQQSFKTLAIGGKFIVIANRHLPYHAHLKRIFSNIKNIASNNKFIILEMNKTKK